MNKATYLFLIIVVLVFRFNSSYAQERITPPRNPNSAKACAICHYRWIDTFFIEGRGSDLVDYTAEKVVASTEMCFSCHDGSIADSRARAYKTPQHKINVPPPDHMKIPDIFPLDEKGNMQCSTCHTAHGVPSGPGVKETVFMRTSNRSSAMCRMCHPDRDGGPAAGNHTLDTAEQKIPPDLVAMGALEGDKANQLICETCHAAHGSAYESYLIKSGKDSSLCLICHGDKNSFTPEGEKRSVHVVNVVPQKAQIPAELIKQGARRGDNGELICQTCHRIHENKTGQPHLLITDRKISAYCLTCHTDKQHITDTRHNLMLSAPGEKNLQGQTASQAGICSACHLPHKAARKLSGTGDFTTRLCVSCHSQGNVAAKLILTGNNHPINVLPFNKDEPDSAIKTANNEKHKLKLPLFNKYGVQDTNGKMTCSTCHDPHRTAEGPSEPGIKAEKAASGSFLRQLAPVICRECHRAKYHIANSKHDLSKVAPDTKNIKNQTPAQSGLCGSCHRVHSARSAFLWGRKIATQQKIGIRSLCVDCHSNEGPAKEKVITDYSHPIDISPAQKGLDTTLPLFDREGKNHKEGTLTCPTCHDPHRWDPADISDSDHYKAEGNSQNSFLRLTNSPESKLCTNCHADQAYIVKTDHDLLISAPASRNLIDQTPQESGTCGVCHLTHNGGNPIRLWARTNNGGDSAMEMLCLSCHSKAGAAPDRIPPIASHPDDKLITNVGRNIKERFNYFPLYDRLTGNPTTVGNISCPSCHNAHQWSPGGRSKGAGVKVEGSADNSFLRFRSRDLLCKDCHGPEALYKYLYFHDAGKRTSKAE